MPKQKQAVPKKTKKNEVQSEKIGIIEKLNTFFRRNNYIVVVWLSIMMLYVIVSNNSYKADVNKKLDNAIYYIKANLGHIGFVSANGTLITAKTKAMDFNDDRLKNVIVNEITTPFLQSGDDITFGYTKKYKKMADMIKNNEEFYSLYKNLATPNGRRELKKIYSAIYKMVSQNLYPEYITVKNKEIISFNVAKLSEDMKSKAQKGRSVYSFRMVVAFKIKTKSWIVQYNKWMNEDLYFKVEAEGYIDPIEYANMNNLIGYRIDKISLPILTKPQI